MSERLTQRVDPFRLAEQGRQLRGSVAITGLRRLVPLLRSCVGAVEVELGFGIDAERVSFMQGRIVGELDITCQRCLGSMTLSVDFEFLLGMVRSEAEGDRLPSRYEPLLVESALISLADVVEDELILALPIIARHADTESCMTPVPGSAAAGQGDDDVSAAKENPFAVLSKLKKE
ncbi:MAG: YceD family protein [Gammaproteobacteria bacterium]